MQKFLARVSFEPDSLHHWHANRDPALLPSSAGFAWKESVGQRFAAALFSLAYAWEKSYSWRCGMATGSGAFQIRVGTAFLLLVCACSTAKTSPRKCCVERRCAND